MKLNKKYFYTLFLTFIFPSNSFASSYYCPKLPINVYIGENLNDEWHIWPENENENLFNKFYYKFSKTKYKVTFWGGFPTGSIRDDTQKKQNFIACCVLHKGAIKKICAFKNVIEDNCEAELPSKGQVKYICPDKNKT